MSLPFPRARASAGFTILEVMLAVAILAVAIALAMSIMLTTGSVTSATLSSSGLEQQVHRTLERLTRELQPARLETVDPQPAAPLGTSVLTYQPAERDASGSIVWGSLRRIELVASPLDPEDGIDNDGNGLVDEREIRLVREVGLPGEHWEPLTRRVASFLGGETENVLDDNGNGLIDERGLSFELRDGVLLIRLTLESKDPQGGVASRTAETAIQLRN